MILTENERRVSHTTQLLLLYYLTMFSDIITFRTIAILSFAYLLNVRTFIKE